MSSLPDPSIPVPDPSLNHRMSDAFRLRWLTKKDVDFRHFSHLKNQLNRDEYGTRRVATFGRDGQEISEDAGRAIVKILRTFEAKKTSGDDTLLAFDS